MRLINFKSIAVKVLGLVVLSTAFSSFSGKLGGESFEIFINNKLVVQEFISKTSGVKSFQLDASNANAQVDIYYNHCGQVGKSRNITIKDGENHLLKEWKFSDASGVKSPMSFKAKELLTIGKTNGTSKLNLYYFSKELPKGRLLAAVLLNNDNKVAP